MTKTIRQSRIRDLIKNRPVRNQEELHSLLQRSGVSATQATLSRDLRELGAVKGPNGYSLMENGGRPTFEEEFSRMVKLFLAHAEPAGQIALLKTAPGNAHTLANAIDRARIEGVLATLAGDDTIFALTKSPGQARRFARHLLSVAKGI